MKGLMYDDPKHFKNETIRLVSKCLKVPHYFNLPYTPCISSGMERLGKEMIGSFRYILSELHLQVGDWPDLLPLIQIALNNSQSPQRNNIAPIKVPN